MIAIGIVIGSIAGQAYESAIKINKENVDEKINWMCYLMSISSRYNTGAIIMAENKIKIDFDYPGMHWLPKEPIHPMCEKMGNNGINNTGKGS